MNYKTYFNKAKGLKLIYPSDWEIELRDNVFSFYNRIDAIGALQFSTFNISSSRIINLKEELFSFLKNKQNRIEVEIINEYAYAHYIDNEGKFWKYWLFLKGEILVLATYNCAEEDIGKEDKEINEIILSSI